MDPIELRIPQYQTSFQIRETLDGRTKLDTDKYETPEGREAETDLMIRSFNREESMSVKSPCILRTHQGIEGATGA